MFINSKVLLWLTTRINKIKAVVLKCFHLFSYLKWNYYIHKSFRYIGHTMHWHKHHNRRNIIQLESLSWIIRNSFQKENEWECVPDLLGLVLGYIWYSVHKETFNLMSVLDIVVLFYFLIINKLIGN